MRKVDKTGQRFGKLIVVKDAGTHWLCKCDCGNPVYKWKNSLCPRMSTRYERQMMCEECRRKLVADLAGTTIGKLKVLEVVSRGNKPAYYIYRCLCECGKECLKSLAYFRYRQGSKVPQSCGCAVSLSHVKRVPRKNPAPNSRSANFLRDKQILIMWDNGKSLRAIGAKYAISHERIRQIICRRVS